MSYSGHGRFVKHYPILFYKKKSDEFPILNTSIFSDDYTISAEILKRLGALFKHFVFLKFNF